MKILVIVPAYNESVSIAGTIKEIREKVPGADILAVNDGSTDETGSILTGCGVKYLDLCVNLGIGGAVQSGYQYAACHDYDYAVQIDGDGQHDPQYILPMIAWMQKENIDVGIGSRFLTHEGFQSSLMRRTGIRFLSWLVRVVCGIRILDVTSGYRIVNSRYIRLFAGNYPDDYPETESIPDIVFSGGKAAEYPVVMRERTGGRSSISMKKSIYLVEKVSLSLLLSRFVRGEEKTAVRPAHRDQ